MNKTFIKNVISVNVQVLSEIMQRRMIILYIMHAQNDINSAIYSIEDIEKRIMTFLRISAEQLVETKIELMNARLIDDNWQLINCTKSSSAERVRRHRAKKNVTPVVTHDVTPVVTHDVTHDVTTKKGTRMSKNMEIPNDWQEWALKNSNFSTEKITKIFEIFSDYWASVAGQKGVKLDWFATWRNWVRREVSNNNNKKELPRNGFSSPTRDYNDGVLINTDGTWDWRQ